MVGETKTAPTSGVTKSAAEQVDSKNLSLDELDFVTLIAMHYTKFGSLLTQELAHEKYDIPPSKFTKWMGKEKVRLAIKEHEVPLERFEAAIKDPENWQTQVISPIQMLVINTMLDLQDQRSDAKKLQDLGVKSRQWQAWLRDPVVRDYIDKRIDNLLHHDGQHIAAMALMDRVSAGDPKAIAYYHEFTGKFTPKSAGGQDYNSVNFQQVVSRMIEIIVEESDPETAFRIGERFKVLMAANNVATELLEQEENNIVVPPTAVGREMTPELKELMERTGGNT